MSSPLQTVRLPSSPELLAPSCFLARLYPLTYGLPDRLLFFMPQSCFKRTSFFRSRSFKSVSTFLVSTISERSEVRHTPDCVTCSHPASSDSAYCHCSLCLHDNFSLSMSLLFFLCKFSASGVRQVPLCSTVAFTALFLYKFPWQPSAFSS